MSTKGTRSESIHPTLSSRDGIIHAASKRKNNVPTIISRCGLLGQDNMTPQEGQGMTLRVTAGQSRTLSRQLNL